MIKWDNICKMPSVVGPPHTAAVGSSCGWGLLGLWSSVSHSHRPVFWRMLKQSRACRKYTQFVLKPKRWPANQEDVSFIFMSSQSDFQSKLVHLNAKKGRCCSCLAHVPGPGPYKSSRAPDPAQLSQRLSSLTLPSLFTFALLPTQCFSVSVRIEPLLYWWCPDLFDVFTQNPAPEWANHAFHLQVEVEGERAWRIRMWMRGHWRPDSSLLLTSSEILHERAKWCYRCFPCCVNKSMQILALLG